MKQIASIDTSCDSLHAVSGGLVTIQNSNELHFWNWTSNYETSLEESDVIIAEHNIHEVVEWKFEDSTYVITLADRTLISFWKDGQRVQQIKIDNVSYGMHICRNWIFIEQSFVMFRPYLKIYEIIKTNTPEELFHLKVVEISDGEIYDRCTSMVITKDQKEFFVGTEIGHIVGFSMDFNTGCSKTKFKEGNQYHIQIQFGKQDIFHTGKIIALQEWPQRNAIISGSIDGSICFWDRDNLTCFKRWSKIQLHTSSVKTIIVLPDQEKLLYVIPREDIEVLCEAPLNGFPQKRKKNVKLKCLQLPYQVNHVAVWREYACFHCSYPQSVIIVKGKFLREVANKGRRGTMENCSTVVDWTPKEQSKRLLAGLTPPRYH